MRRALLTPAALLLGALLSAAPTPALAHELEEASVALVIRPDGLVEARLMVPWAVVLQARLAPPLDPVAFLTQLVNQPAAAFATTVRTVERDIERELRLGDAGRGVAFTRWQWPTPADIQRALREELMSRLADGAAFRHASRLAAQASVRPSTPAAQSRLIVPAALGPVLLTVTHPLEQLIPRGGVSTSFPLRR
jgi:hypothetical protein